MQRIHFANLVAITSLEFCPRFGIQGYEQIAIFNRRPNRPFSVTVVTTAVVTAAAVTAAAVVVVALVVMVILLMLVLLMLFTMLLMMMLLMMTALPQARCCSLGPHLDE